MVRTTTMYRDDVVDVHGRIEELGHVIPLLVDFSYGFRVLGALSTDPRAPLRGMNRPGFTGDSIS